MVIAGVKRKGLLSPCQITKGQQRRENGDEIHFAKHDFSLRTDLHGPLRRFRACTYECSCPRKRNGEADAVFQPRVLKLGRFTTVVSRSTGTAGMAKSPGR